MKKIISITSIVFAVIIVIGGVSFLLSNESEKSEVAPLRQGFEGQGSQESVNVPVQELTTDNLQLITNEVEEKGLFESIIEKPVALGEKVIEKVDTKVEAFKDEYISKPEMLYAVPFIPQAPHANWNAPYDEACEEASMLMAVEYIKRNKVAFDSNTTISTTTISADTANKMIVDFVAWQTQHGYSVDLTAQEMVDTFQEYFKLTTTLLQYPTVDDLKKALAEGNLIVVPVAGRLLENPYFQTPGPIYHVLIITGYDDAQKEFITNDPGTRRGYKFRYDYDHLVSVIRDWHGGDVLNGESVVVLVNTNN